MKSSQRLARAQRLRTPSDYRRVYQTKQWGGSTHHTFNIKSTDAELTNPLATARTESNRASALGVTVSKKVSSLAVVRNRIKRQTKEFYRYRQHKLLDVELVITAKPSCAAATDDERSQSLELLWEKILKWQHWYRKTQIVESSDPID